jgi:hypothetical protein
LAVLRAQAQHLVAESDETRYMLRRMPETAFHEWRAVTRRKFLSEEREEIEAEHAAEVDDGGGDEAELELEAPAEDDDSPTDGLDELHEDPPEEPGDEEPEPPRRPSRARDRIRDLAARLKARDEELRLVHLHLDNQRPQQPQADPRQRAWLDHLVAQTAAQLPPEQREQYTIDKLREEFRQQQQHQILEVDNQLDRSGFEHLMRDYQLPASYSIAVEQALNEARAQGMNPKREMLLASIIGREVMAQKREQTEQQRIRGQRRVASQTTRPGGAARSTAESPRGRRQTQEAEDEALLRGSTVADFLRNTDRW